MKNKIGVSRRNFLRQTTLGLGAGIVGVSVPSCNVNRSGENKKLPREVSVAGIDLKGLWPDTTRESRIRRIMDRMKEIVGLQPDIICLPELFDTMWVSENLPLSEVAEDENVPGPVTSRIAEFAKKYNCYIVCPVYTKKDGHFYNSSLLVDRKGSIAGVYHKIHPVKSEILSKSITKEGM